MQKIEPLKQTLDSLKELMSNEVKNCNISDDTDQFMIGKRGLCPNVVMNERHKLALHRSNPLKSKLFRLPAELKFVSAKKAIRDENLKILLREKEKRIVTRAMMQLEREFSNRRNTATLSLPQLDKQKKRINSDVHEVCDREDKKYKDLTDFLTNIQNLYERLHGNMSHVQHFQERVPEKQRTTNEVRRKENVKLSPITPKEKANRNEIKNEIADISVADERTNQSKKKEKDETMQRISNVDKCLYESGQDIPRERLEMKIPAEDHGKNKNNSAERERKWKMLYYWTVWRKVTLKSRKENHKLIRIKKIDSFLMRLEKTAEQVQTLEKLADGFISQKIQKKSSSHPNKRSIQARNERETEEIRQLDKMEKDLSESAIEVHERLQKSLKEFHPKIRPKLKALSVFTNVKNKYKSISTETRRVYPTPAFLVEMENRYNERKKRWENIRKKRSEMEAEKERIIREREEEEKKMEDLKKREKLEELKKKRRLEKEAEEQRKRERRMLMQELKLAQNHYARYLMEKVGFQRWRKLVQLRRDQMERAHHHSEVHTCRIFLLRWRRFTALQLGQKYRRAQELYDHMLVKNSLHSWMLQHDEYLQKIQVAVDWAEAKLSEKTFALWNEYAQTERWYFLQKMELAESFHKRKTLARFLDKWKEFPKWVKAEKEKEKRKKIWQRKVQEFLPDYQPAFISEI